ncbi:hypothetical protein [Microbacterium memoriense]|uniref:Phage holin family protein n=1 Tax=Microbacterium memoriense TaxID=2978350 RepID=A0ABT2PFU5_9MICO|nr:hypothetical protein [Microbacterium memoriense]MCT9002723.1 hypothetical protein [Microbacterium memoriense]
MKTWIVRFASLYVFNLVVLFAVGLLLPNVSVGWAALWASVILTAATLWLKPVVSKIFTGAARKSAGQRTRLGEKLVQYGIVFLVELIIWVLVVIFSGVRVGGFFWGWVIPPILLAIAWIIYDLADDRIHRTAGELYDKADAGIRGTRGTTAAAPAAPTAAGREGAAELRDGLTAEQRRMLDELGKS